MLLGEQGNVGWFDFVPGENAETLIEKYQAQLAKLDTLERGAVFSGYWGGSPFNAANRVVLDKENYDVTAGVNIPMLVETLMARDDDLGFAELVGIAVETGREGVKAQKTPVAAGTRRTYENWPGAHRRPPDPWPGGDVLEPRRPTCHALSW
nr:Magnesium and cobalt efflux protein CorC [Candidatus Pantoea persica]